jgi:hypothetical protein
MPFGGLLGGLNDALFGAPPSIGRSGAFQNIKEIGGDLSEFLLDILTADVSESDAFQRGSAAIRDAISAQTATGRQRVGDTATAGGFLDSGALNTALVDIERGGIGSFAEQIRALIQSLEDRKFSFALPFLQAASGESVAVGTANLQADIAARGQDVGFYQQLLPRTNVNISPPKLFG